jgi:hypothetical protein
LLSSASSYHSMQTATASLGREAAETTAVLKSQTLLILISLKTLSKKLHNDSQEVLVYRWF